MTGQLDIFGAAIDQRDPLELRFEAFHEANPNVYRLFERFTKEAIAAGRVRIGAKAIFERMRWYFAFETTGDTFKLNNSFTSFYARLFMADHPEHADLFETRERRSA
ncbi:MAG: hypothetical protein VW405_13170 [Rhodospirillaceae bacterium]